jgi:hypothetical protein
VSLGTLPTDPEKSTTLMYAGEQHDQDFKEQLETLNAQARKLEDTIAKNVAEILEA